MGDHLSDHVLDRFGIHLTGRRPKPAPQIEITIVKKKQAVEKGSECFERLSMNGK
jgi:Mg-chelatase subunit ChlI